MHHVKLKQFTIIVSMVTKKFNLLVVAIIVDCFNVVIAKLKLISMLVAVSIYSFTLYRFQPTFHFMTKVRLATI